MDHSKDSHRNGKILIIEDNGEMRSLLQDFVEEEGFEADSVEKRTSAFKKLMTECLDLIITDIRLLGYSGLDILPELKRVQPEIPIIVITAFGSEKVYCKALSRKAVSIWKSQSISIN